MAEQCSARHIHFTRCSMVLLEVALLSFVRCNALACITFFRLHRCHLSFEGLNAFKSSVFDGSACNDVDEFESISATTLAPAQKPTTHLRQLGRLIPCVPIAVPPLFISNYSASDTEICKFFSAINQ